jgi:hypothetical protein
MSSSGKSGRFFLFPFFLLRLAAPKVVPRDGYGTAFGFVPAPAHPGEFTVPKETVCHLIFAQ